MVEVIPAILEQDFPAIEKKIHSVEGLVSWVQIDLADSTLVPNATFLDPEPFAGIIESHKDTPGVARRVYPVRNSSGVERSENGQPRKLEFELHMMVKDPLRYLERFAQVGFKRFFAHIEGDYVEEYLAKCYQLGVEVGLAIDGPTPFTKIHSFLDNLDCVLVMAIEAGESGRPFREDTIEKIKKIKEIDFDIPVSIDGAMNPENAKKVVEAGATRINSNSYVFSSPNIEEAINLLKQGPSKF